MQIHSNTNKFKSMRNNFKTIALFISMGFATQVSAEKFIDGIVYEEYNETYAQVKSSSQEIEIADILAKVNINGQEYVVDSIASRAFFNSKMTSVLIPSSIRSIGEKAFYGCKGLTTLEIPSSVNYLGENAFEKCTAIEIVSISTALKVIPEGTLYGCKSLRSVVIPSSKTFIGKRAFEQCDNLPLVILPQYMTLIDEDAFKNCKSLNTIVSYPALPPAIAKNAFYMTPENPVIYVPAESLDSYPVAEGWDVFHDIRALGSIDLVISSSELDLHIGEDATLTVSIDKAYDVTILSEEWTTSNPEVVTIKDGLVTALDEGIATISFTVIDGSGCPHIASCDVYVDGVSGIEGVEVENCLDKQVECYNLNGVRINNETLASGLYIKKEGKRSIKLLIK